MRRQSEIDSLRGKASVAARARIRLARARASAFSGAVRVFGPVFRGVRQVDLRTDGIDIWTVHSDGTIGRRRSYESFCRLMNRRLWRLAAAGARAGACCAALAALLIAVGCIAPRRAAFPSAAIVHSPAPRTITWHGDGWDEVYFINWSPFMPDVWIVLAGPLQFAGTNLLYLTDEPGLYAVGAECRPGLAGK